MIRLGDFLVESIASKKRPREVYRDNAVDPETVKKGDRLRIKKDLSEYPVDNYTGNCVPVVAGIAIFKSMRYYLGKVVTVKDIYKTAGKGYKTEAVVRVAENSYGWPIEIFEYV